MELCSKMRLKQQKMMEVVTVREGTGRILKCVYNFKYLGTTLTLGYRMSMRDEVVKRIASAHTVVTSLKQIWRDKALGNRLRRELFMTLIISVLLYGAEVWVLEKEEKEGK